jgi:hypothetical protein
MDRCGPRRLRNVRFLDYFWPVVATRQALWGWGRRPFAAGGDFAFGWSLGRSRTPANLVARRKLGLDRRRIAARGTGAIGWQSAQYRPYFRDDPADLAQAVAAESLVDAADRTDQPDLDAYRETQFRGHLPPR